MEGCRALVAIIARVAGQHPQTAYAGLHKSLQQEWDFVQGVTPTMGLSLHPMEDICVTHPYCHSSRGTLTRYLGGQSLICNSRTFGLISKNLPISRAPTGRHPVSSHDTSS